MVSSSIVLVLTLATVGVAEDGVPRMDSLSGVVIGPEGRPLPDAEVFATSGGLEGQPTSLLGRTHSNGEGRFVLPLHEKVSTCDQPKLWAVAEGMVVGTCPVDQRTIQGEPVRILLGSTGGARFLVADPDGRPILGAKIIPRTVARDASEIPRIVAAEVSGTTDHEGLAELEGFRPEELLSVAIEAPGYGIQVRDFRGNDGLADVGTKGITLLRCGRVVGRVFSEDPRAVVGLNVRVESSGARGTSNTGSAEVETDPNGRFEIPAIAAGALTIRVRPRNGSPDLPAYISHRRLEAGKELSIEIPFRRGVRVTGLALSSLDGRPIPGVSVSVVPSGTAEAATVVTDEQGRYEAFVPAGLVSHRVLKVPAPYLCLPRFLGPRAVEIPPAIARFELPEIRLQPGGELRGTVLNSNDQAVAGARVEASWMMVEGRTRAPRSEATATRADGSFVLHPVPGDSEISLTADLGEASTDRPITTRTFSTKPVVLHLAEPDGKVASGLVRSIDGRPIAGASVRIWSIKRTPGGSIDAVRLLRFDDPDDLTTDEDGRFQTPGPLRRDREYRAFASAEGFGPAQTRLIQRSEIDPVIFPDMVLDRDRRMVTVEGRVVDRSGKPLAEVKIWTSAEGPCCHRTSTDLDGRFRLQDVPEGPLFLFADQTGFRFFGREIDANKSNVEIRLTRLAEPAEASMTTQKVTSSGLSLARRVLTPYAEKVLTEGDYATRIRTLELLASVDPRRVLRLLEDKVVEDGPLADHLRHMASRSTATEGQAEQRAVVESIQDAERRVIGALEAAHALPENSSALKREWIDRALNDARTITDPSRRVVALARVADRLIDMGQADQAKRLLEEARPIADSLPAATSGGRAKVEFAGTLARVDPAAALTLTETLVDPAAFDRCRVLIACRLASRDPVEAARVLDSLRDPRSIAPALPSLCHALATVDPSQARRLISRARSDDPCLGPYALGLMALAIAETDKPQATSWLREAFEKLAQVSASPVSTQPFRDPASVAAALLPVAERIDPRLVPELFWRALSLHAARSGSEISNDAILALLLARYDRAVTRTFFDPLADHALASGTTDLCPMIAALAVLDPFRAVRLIEGLPEPADLTFHQAKNEARLTLTAALLRGTPGCWDDAVVRYLRLATEASLDQN